jgi:hypothetical protein
MPKEHLCPKCQSRAISRVELKNVLERLILALRRRRMYRCLEGDHRFYDRPVSKQEWLAHRLVPALVRAHGRAPCAGGSAHLLDNVRLYAARRRAQASTPKPSPNSKIVEGSGTALKAKSSNENPARPVPLPAMRNLGINSSPARRSPDPTQRSLSSSGRLFSCRTCVRKRSSRAGRTREDFMAP